MSDPSNRSRARVGEPVSGGGKDSKGRGKQGRRQPIPERNQSTEERDLIRGQPASAQGKEKRRTGR